MSYILDALRRADSERERGAVPGVHAQALLPGSADPDAAPPSRRWHVVSSVLAALLVAAVGWQLVDHGAPAPVDEAAPLTPKPVAESAEAPAAVAVSVPVSLPVSAPVTAAVAAPAAKPVPRVVAPPARPASMQLVAAAKPAPPARIPMASELPDDVRASLPTLTIGGASYSQNPESRMLIVNGQVFREGDKLSADVTLEQIRLKEAVLSTKGVRYRIAY